MEHSLRENELRQYRAHSTKETYIRPRRWQMKIYWCCWQTFWLEFNCLRSLSLANRIDKNVKVSIFQKLFLLYQILDKKNRYYSKCISMYLSGVVGKTTRDQIFWTLIILSQFAHRSIPSFCRLLLQTFRSTQTHYIVHSNENF